MATIGLDKLFVAPITEDSNGNETYGTPVQLAKAISAELSVELNEAILYADDGQAESVKEFKSGTLSLNIDDLGHANAALLLGAEVDENGVLISRGEDNPTYVAVGFRARKANGKYRYFWLYRVQFAVPGTSLATKGDSITFSTPTIEGTIFQRKKVDGRSKHPWKAEVTEDGTNQTVINAWYTAVYEPDYPNV
jgi:phi13 family phage major tail protein